MCLGSEGWPTPLSAESFGLVERGRRLGNQCLEGEEITSQPLIGEGQRVEDKSAYLTLVGAKA